MDLPKGFRERMEVLLGEEYPDFLKSYEGERAQGLRLNGWKTEEGRRRGTGSRAAVRAGRILPAACSLGCGRILLWGGLPPRTQPAPRGRGLLYPGAKRHVRGSAS